MRYAHCLPALLALALGAAAPALAGDHERARAAFERGDILSLAEVLAAARAIQPGAVMEVELEREDGRWIYELTVLAPDGHLMEMEIDAATAEVIDLDREDD